MSDIALDTTDDDILLDDSNDLTLTTGVDAIEQHLKQRLRTFLEEWFLDKRIGIPWFQQVLKKNPDEVIVDSVIKREIINTPGINELTEFSLDIDNTRELDVDFRAQTTDGEITFDEVLP